MKRVFKKNQIIIAALAVMIAVAGYLNYSGKIFHEKDGGAEEANADLANQELLDISEEDIETVGDEIASNDSDVEGTPGEAVLTNGSAETTVAQAKVTREQVRAQNKETLQAIIDNTNLSESEKQEAVSQLVQWPCQIKLVPVSAPYFDGANLLVAADCSAYAYARMHEKFMRGNITIIGCPKLDNIDYSEKLTQIIQNNDIKKVTIVRMEVPCCGGLEMAVKKALQASGKFIPWQVVTISMDGRILE